MKKPYLHRIIYFQIGKILIPGYYIFIYLLIVAYVTVAFLGCTPKQMTLDEAMKTTISMRGKSFVPPPRSIDDIFNVIAREDTKDGSISKDWIKLLNVDLPKNSSRQDLTEFYIKRARAASKLGYFDKCREDIVKAYDLSRPEKFDPRIIVIWANCELNLQNYKRAIILNNILKERGRWKYMPYANLAYIYALTGHFQDAENIRYEAIEYFKNHNVSLNSGDEVHKAILDYTVLNMKGKYKEAEPIMIQAIDSATAVRPHAPNWVQVQRIRLIRNLIGQNRLIEAELEARKTIEESVKYLGTGSIHLLAANTILAEVLLSQGRLNDAEKLTKTAIHSYEQSGVSSTFGWWSRSIETLCKILVVKGDYSGAIRQYEFFRSKKESNPYIYDAFYSNDKNVMLALVMSGKCNEALELIENAYRKTENLLGKKHLHTAELLALRGMVNNSISNLESAYLDFSEAIPLIAQSKTYVANRLANHRYQLILESYLDLLTKISGSFIEERYSFSASAKALEASMRLSDSTVQSAVIASTGRMSIQDSKLKEFARTEQDTQQQIIAYQNLIQTLLAKRFDEIDHQAINNVKDALEKLRASREIIIDEIERQFPDYANLVNYRQPSIDDIQRILKADEVIISISTTKSSTYVFAVHPSGPPEMVRLEIGKKDLEALVSGIKESLYPKSFLLGQLPPYDFSKAYELYSLFLKPIEDNWKNSKNLIFSTSGPLGQIPLSILITKPFQLAEEKEVLFSNYRNAPWLIRRFSINTVPSVGSLVALRSISRAIDAKEAFVGFGDPLFNKSQLAQALNENKIHQAEKNADRTKLDIRGIRVIKDGNLDDKMLASCKIEALERLPDTADELLSLAEALNADPVRDVYLGKMASEKQVKSMDLSNRQVVAFASHALVPYDLDGLDQPAIAMSAPSVTGDKDDGLLTMAEILDLKLNADWVVLSACNTGAADGAGAEAVSGLGRAFFYAGTKAVLVSMWPVETSSAKKLTTSIFQHLKDNVGINKAQAHQRAMIEFIEGPGMIDVDGRLIASYAHPFFWAPFVIVGDYEIENPN